MQTCVNSGFLFALLVISAAIRFVNAYVVTGATTDINAQSGQRPFRRDILDMQSAGGPAWDLYLISLLIIQQKNQSDPFSWFGFAGIHGFPAKKWDGVKSTKSPQTPGYAMHDDILFGTWHRVYLAAYEQVVLNVAQQLATQYPASKRSAYEAAAANLRIPYWDWASSSPAMPAVLTNPTIVVNAPQGQGTISNPLATYAFHPIPSGGAFPSNFPLSKDAQTVRTPGSSGKSNTAGVNKKLLANAVSIRDRVYYLMARQTHYAPFSNTGYPAKLRNGSDDSIESVHNQIHGLVGGSGHMGYIPFSSFDPIFFLHHTNIDRLFALWSAIHPDSYVIPQKNKIGTWSEAPGTVEDINTPLTPFHRDSAGNFHTSVTARSTRTFGYTYPELVDWNVTPAQLASKARAAVESLYNPTGKLSARRVGGFGRLMRRPYAHRDWFINFSVKRNVAAPLSVHFFLGPPPEQAEDWGTASNLIVSQMVLPDLTVSGVGAPALAQIPLSRSLLDAQKGDGLDDIENIESYLKTNLQWRVQYTTGGVVDVKSLTDLKIAVVDQSVEASDVAGEFNRYGKFIYHKHLRWGHH